MMLKDLAPQLGMSVDRLASYEYARAPLRYAAGRTVCQLFNVSQRWLATGLRPKAICIPIPDNVGQVLDERALFTEVYDHHLAEFASKFYEFLTKEAKLGIVDFGGLRELQRAITNTGSLPEMVAQAEHLIKQVIDSQLNCLPSLMLADYADAVVGAGIRFMQANLSEIKAYLRHPTVLVGVPEQVPSSNKPRIKVDNVEGVEYQSRTDMKNLWRDYQKRLMQLCKVRGAQAAIAKRLKVSRTIVSKWASGKAEPSADYALHLIEWIKAEEAKGKT